MRRALILSLVLATGCATAPAPQVPPPPSVAEQKPLLGEHGFDLSQMDRSVNACDNFYEFAVGGWRKANPLPPAFGRFGRFEEIAERNRQTLRTILEQGSGQTGDFYRACMDEQGIEARGLAPIQDQLDRIGAIDDVSDVIAEIHHLQRYPTPTFGIELRSGNPVFRFQAQNDYKNSNEIIAAVTQGGLGLPDRDYYIRRDDRLETVRKEYLQHIARMFELTGTPRMRAELDAQRVIALEAELAVVSMARTDLRVPEKVYNPTSLETLNASQPMFRWRDFFAAAGLGDVATVNVAQPEFFKAVNRLLEEIPVATWKAYLRWNVLDAAAPMLPAAFQQQDFAFRGRVLSGQQEMHPRWKQCVLMADVSIGHLIGQEYVRRNFTPEAKQKMSDLIDNLVSALGDRIPALEWMGPDTKREAMAKLNAFKRRIGYPDQWRDYTTLEVRPDAYAENVLAARHHAFRRAVERIGKPDDPNEWGVFTPATVNASYNPARNFITFPAGILQPPFYDPNADDAYNYGGIGMVIGHEMTHGFDDSGAKFDAAGNLRNWWSEADLENFQARAECIQNQYGRFNVEPGLNLQGKLVTGEAIADLGGTALALRAYQRSLEGKERRIIDGFTPEQRFFLGMAQVWGQNMSAEEARKRALTDPHAPGPFRVNGTVANMPEFHQAWNCGEGSPMVRASAERCNIW